MRQREVLGMHRCEYQCEVATRWRLGRYVPVGEATSSDPGRSAGPPRYPEIFATRHLQHPTCYCTSTQTESVGQWRQLPKSNHKRHTNHLTRSATVASPAAITSVVSTSSSRNLPVQPFLPQSAAVSCPFSAQKASDLHVPLHLHLTLGIASRTAWSIILAVTDSFCCPSNDF